MKPLETGYAKRREVKEVAQSARLNSLSSNAGGARVSSWPNGTLIEVPRSAQRKGIKQGSRVCKLSLSLIRPEGYTAAEDPAKGWVTWGVVNNVVIDDVATPFTLSTGVKIWVAVTTNGAVPLRVLTATLAGGAAVPDDIGGTATTPPTTAHYLLGQVGGAGTEESPFNVFSTGCGSLNLSVVSTGYSCVLSDPGDPEEDPPIPPTAGGVKTDYQLRWDRV
jgi:hypothetical protein